MISHEQTAHSLYLESVVLSGRDLTTCVGHLIDYCQNLLPATIWEELRKLDYAADAEGLKNWLGALLAAEPPGDDVEALWFGLQMWRGPGDLQDCVFYVSGSDYFDVRDPNWHNLPIYWPAGRKTNSVVLQEMHRMLRQAGGRALPLGQYMLGLGYCCLAAAGACAGSDLGLLIGDRQQRHVGVGFDDGDYMIVGKVDRHGWHRVTSARELVGAAAAKAKATSAPASQVEAGVGKREGGAFGKLLRAAWSAIYALAGIEAEPAPAPPVQAMKVEPADPLDGAFAPVVGPVAPLELPLEPPTPESAMLAVEEAAWEPPAPESAMSAVEEATWEPPVPQAELPAVEEAAWEAPAPETEVPDEGEAAWWPPAPETAMPGVAGTAWSLPARETGVPRMRVAAQGLPVPDAMRADAEQAVGLARTRFQVELDYSEQSLESVEWILGALYDAANPRDRLDVLLERVLGEWYDLYTRYFPRQVREQGLTEGELWKMSRIWGAYVGEVMRMRWQGEWAVEEPTHGEAMIALRVQRSAVFPLAKVYERLANGPDGNIWFYYRALKQRFDRPS